MKDIENKIIDKDAKLKFMEMQKKNEDLASKLEYDFPQESFNELGGLEDGQNMMDNFDQQNVEPPTEDFNPNDYNPRFKNSLFVMEQNAGEFRQQIATAIEQIGSPDPYQNSFLD